MRFFALIALAVLAVAFAAGRPDTSAAGPKTGSEGRFVSNPLPGDGSQPANEITVRFRPGVTYTARTQLNARAGVTTI